MYLKCGIMYRKKMYFPLQKSNKLCIDISYLKFQEFWNIKSKGKNCDQYDIEGRMTASNSDPKWPTNGKIPLQTDSQCSEYRAYFGNVS